MPTFSKSITYLGQVAVISCDRRCSHAWGLDNRQRTEHDPDDPDDASWPSDDEAGPAPTDRFLGAEGLDTKPENARSGEDMNRWCARACERRTMSPPGDPRPYPPQNWSQRRYNQPWKHEGGSK